MKLQAPTKSRQRGAVLLTLFLVVFAVAATVFLASVDTHAVEVREFKDLRAEMEKAKQALIAYAAMHPGLGLDHDGDSFTDDEGPGRLPCPDIDNDGLTESGVSDCTDNVRGRLPEKITIGSNTMFLNDTYASKDQQFWYVVAPAFKEITSNDVNHQTTGTLSIDGVSGYAAVIIAPGEALATQDRSASQTSAANYLEQGNLSGTSFVNTYSDLTVFNDQVIGIKPSELMIQTLRDDVFDNKLSTIREKMRQALAQYWTDNGTIISTQSALNTYMQDKGYGWFIDENYLSTTFNNYYYNSGYPYIRYNKIGCTTYYYWFIPVSPYSPNNTYVSGTAC